MSANGLNDLKKELESLKVKLKGATSTIPSKLGDDFISNVTDQSRYIYNKRMRHSVADGNHKTYEGNNAIRISNDTQHATYAEFGTGTVGQAFPKHPIATNWQHNVAGRKPNEGWVYFDDGSFWYTKGVAANPTYYTSFRMTVDEYPKIGRKVIEEAIK